MTTNDQICRHAVVIRKKFTSICLTYCTLRGDQYLRSDDGNIRIHTKGIERNFEALLRRKVG